MKSLDANAIRMISGGMHADTIVSEHDFAKDVSVFASYLGILHYSSKATSHFGCLAGIPSLAPAVALTAVAIYKHPDFISVLKNKAVHYFYPL